MDPIKEAMIREEDTGEHNPALDWFRETHNPECGLDCVSAGAVRLDNTPSADQQTGRQHLAGDQSAEQAKNFMHALHTAIEQHIGVARSVSDAYMVALAMNRMGFVIVPKQTVDVYEEMLEALKALESWVTPSNDWRPDTTLARRVRAAISKAEGRDR